MDVFVFGAVCDTGKEHDAAYELLAYAVRQVFGLNELPVVERMEGGKPYFPNHTGICFNLSHSHGAVVCAVHDKNVGVDVEKLRPAPKRLAGGVDDRAFFCRWTAKEATVKLEGRGAGALLRDFEPSERCSTSEELLPGWIVTVCPSEETQIRFISV